MIRVSLLDACDWSEKIGADQSIFSSGRLRPPLQNMLFFCSGCLIRPLLKIDTQFL
jgi:hypothetical protein